MLVPPALVLAYDAPARAGDWGWQAMCWAVGLLGVVIRAKTIGHVPPGTSGRNTSEGQVAETLNTRGMYSLVRHPLYLGNYFMWMALVLATGRLDFALVVTLAYMMYYLRIAMAEEAFLAGKFGADVQRLDGHRACLRAQILGHAPEFLDARRQRLFPASCDQA